MITHEDHAADILAANAETIRTSNPLSEDFAEARDAITRVRNWMDKTHAAFEKIASHRDEIRKLEDEITRFGGEL